MAVEKELDKRTEILHDIANRVADLNIEPQLEVAIETLDFLQEIEDKTADDLRKIKEQDKFIDMLTGIEYRDRLRNILTEHFDSLSDFHLEKYHEELVYEETIAKLNVRLVPELQEVQQELIYGVFEKKPIH